jgi:hypothetical protein
MSRAAPIREWRATGRLGGRQAVKDIVWSYPAPIPECPKIENLLSFYNEHVDLHVDGVLQDRPITPPSHNVEITKPNIRGYSAHDS